MHIMHVQAHSYRHEFTHMQVNDSQFNNSLGPDPTPRDCKEAFDNGCRRDGVYTIDPGCGKSFNVFCDMKNGGWTVFQRRRDGSEDFYRGWADYVTGFGSLKREFWLGLDHINCLTTAVPRTNDRFGRLYWEI